jgi:hypothetical protein
MSIEIDIDAIRAGAATHRFPSLLGCDAVASNRYGKGFCAVHPRRLETAISQKLLSQVRALPALHPSTTSTFFVDSPITG